MQAGVRARIRDLASRARTGATSPSTLVALLSASAVAPVVAVAGTGTGAAALAATGVVGSVGSGVLTGVITEALDRLRAGEAGTDVDAVERVLVDRIEEVLDVGGEEAEALRRDVAGVLIEVGAARVAVEAAVEAGDAELRSHITEVFSVLPRHFAEFRDLLQQALDVLAGMQERLQQKETEQHGAVNLSRQTLMEVRLLRNDLDALRQHLSVSPTSSVKGDPSATWADRSPYLGLAPFGEEHTEVFFGREQTTAEIMGMLARCLSAPSVLLVTGPSGCGKSSLLAAGVSPAIARGMLGVPASDRWPRTSIVPGKRPLDELAFSLAQLDGELTPESVRHRLESSPEDAHLVVRQVVGRYQAGLTDRRDLEGLEAGAALDEPNSTAADARLVLIVDQFEQLFTLAGQGATGSAEANAFVTALMAMATVSGGLARMPPAVVILSVRGDYWDYCAADPFLGQVLQDHQFVVGPMTRRELRRAVSGPATVAGLELEDGLVGHILDELGPVEPMHGAGVATLPLLSQAMFNTWSHREGRRLTLEGYVASGGVTRAVEVSAGAAYDGLSSDQQRLARRLLLRLTTVTRETGVVRRGATMEELRHVVAPAAPDDVNTVLEAFVDHRLLVRDGTTVELAHDVLLEAWPRLRGWLQEDRDRLLQYGRLAESAATWRDEDRDPSYLYRGAELEAARELVEVWNDSDGRFPGLDGMSREFLETSLRSDRHRRTRRRLGATALAAATLVAVVLGTLFTYQRRVTANREAESASRQLAELAARHVDDDPSLSMLAALAAYERAPTAEAERAMFRHYIEHQQVDAVLSGPPGEIVHVDASADGRVIGAVSEPGVVTVWTREHGGRMEERPLNTDTDHPQRALGLTVSNDGETVLVFAADHLAVYDTSTGSREWEVPMSPGELINTTQWEIADNGLVALRRIAEDAPNRFELWEPGSSEPNLIADHEFSIDTAPPSIVGFGPDPHMVVINQGLWDDEGNHQGADLRVWDTRSGTVESVPVEGVTSALATTDDGEAVICRDEATVSWALVDVETGTETPAIELGDRGCFDVLAFDGDAEVAVGWTTSPSGEDRNEYWAADLRTGEVTAQPEPSLADFPATASTLIADGGRRIRVLVAGSAIYLVEVARHESSSDIRWASIAPDGDLVVAAVEGGSIATIAPEMVETGQPLPSQREAEPVTGWADRPPESDPVESLAVSYSESLVADRLAGGRLQVRRLPDLELVAELDSDLAERAESQVNLSWTGEHLKVIAGARAEWWDPVTGERQEELDLIELGIIDDDEGVQLAPHSSPEIAVFWDDDGRDIHSVEIETGNAATLTAGISPTSTQYQADSHHLAVLSLDGQLEVWDLDQQQVTVGPLAARFSSAPGTELDPFVAQFLSEPGTFFVGAGGLLSWYKTGSSAPARALEVGETRAAEAVSSTGDALLYRPIADELTLEIGEPEWSDEVYALDLQPEAWREHLCTLLNGRVFTEDEMNLYPVTTSDPCT